MLEVACCNHFRSQIIEALIGLLTTPGFDGIDMDLRQANEDQRSFYRNLLRSEL